MAGIAIIVYSIGIMPRVRRMKIIMKQDFRGFRIIFSSSIPGRGIQCKGLTRDRTG